jgi:23S rRNA (guanosine2251-2'-O)-methyltransferase
MTDNRSWRGTTTIAVYGRRAVLEAIAAARDGVAAVELVRIAQDLPAPLRREFRDGATEVEAAFEVTSLGEVGVLSRDPRNDQGVAARVRLLGVVDVETFAESIKGQRAAAPTRLIATDGITNPQNIGMIIRAALGAGFDAIMWPRQGCPWVNGLVVKASAATVLRATIVTCEALSEGIAALQGYGFRAVGLDALATNSVWEAASPHRAVYVVGSELEGISADVGALLDDAVAIPMAGGVESLNAATAAAVLCFAMTRGTSAKQAPPRAKMP